MSNAPRCRCGHTVEEHIHIAGTDFNNDKNWRCAKCKCEEFFMSDLLEGKGKVADTEAKLREVLQNKYQEFCPNCEKQLGIADTSWEDTESSTDCKIICQDCYTTLVDISTLRYTNFRITGFIETLEKFPEKNKIK